MTVDTNTITSNDLAAQSIDFVEQFKDSAKKLIEVLGAGVRMVPMSAGSIIKTYKNVTTKAADRTVAEGEQIPLTKISRKVDQTYTLALTDKLRKVTTFEAIQAVGFEKAVANTDLKLLHIAQMNAKEDLFNAMDSKSTTKVQGGNFQKSLSKALGKTVGLFEDTDGVGNTVAFVNPDDFYDYLGDQKITLQNVFGLQYVKNFLNINTIILSASVPAGKVFVTVDNNIAFYYVDVNGDAGKTFNMQVDESGLIGVTHDQINNSLSYETVAAGGWLFIPERTDGIVTATIQAQGVKPAVAGK